MVCIFKYPGSSEKSYTVKILYIIIFISLFGVFTGMHQSPVRQGNCRNCHGSLFEMEHIHPVIEDDCENCHEPTGEVHPKSDVKGFQLAVEVPELCYICHEPENTMKKVHYPVDDGDCLACHSPHSSAIAGLLNTSTVSEGCFQCHDQEVFNYPSQHQPVREGNCTGCHNPHQSDFSGFLKKESPQLCFTCHVEYRSAMDLANIHPPFEDDCANCHQAHGASQKNLLAQNMPGLCYNCHDDIQGDAEKTVKHKPMEEGGTCSNCHSPHASDEDFFLIRNNTDLCLDCHNRTMKTDSGTIANMKQLFKKRSVMHAAIDNGGCTVCHQPHGSEQPSLLNGSFPDEKYTSGVPGNYELCFNCHDSDLLTEKNTRYGTNFRNGEQNLHFLHLTGDLGRNCTLCHNVHAANNQHLVEENISYGNWVMQMNFKFSETGGSCFPGCHGEATYNRNPVP